MKSDNPVLGSLYDEQKARETLRKREAWLRQTQERIVSMDQDARRDLIATLRREVLTHPPRNSAELHQAARALYGINIPVKSTHPDFNAPFEYYAKLYFGTVEDAVALAARGGGKALYIMTPIPTPDGWTVMGELRVGDRVYDSRGNPCVVTLVTETMRQNPCYRVVFDDGNEIVADAEHQWIVHTKAVRAAIRRRTKLEAEGRPLRKRREGVMVGPVVLTTQQMLDNMGVGQPRVGHHHNGKRECNNAILLTEPVEGVERVFELDPYVLGLWLGDRCAYHASISTSDQEVLQALTDAGYTIKPIKGSKGQCDYRVNDGLYRQLAALGLWENKHIPEQYVSASIAQRVALVQGLMDSDGTVQESGKCAFDNGNLKIVRALKQVLESLGVKVSMSSRRPRCNGKDCKRSYRLWFTTDRFNPFRLKRKRERVRGVVRETQKYRYVVSITPVPSVPVCCIQVDSPDHSYLAGEFYTVTHNTLGTSAVSNVLLMSNPGFTAVHAGGTKAQAQVASSYLNMFYNKPPLKDYFDGKPGTFTARFKNDSLWLIATGSMKGVSGQHPALLTLDEIEFWDIDALIQTFEVPIERDGYKRRWAAFSTRQRGFGAMNWLVEEAPKRGFHFFQWTTFEMMQPCKTCVAIDQEPHGTEEARTKVCNLYKACRGERAKKASGWLTLKQAQDKCRRLGGPDGREWRTQGLCERPSSHGLVLHNFERKYRPEGNYTKWTYVRELPLIVLHDPSEGKKSVLYFLQYHEGNTFVFDELVNPECADVTQAKQEFWEHSMRMGYRDPEVLVVDPHRTDAVATWKRGSKSGVGILKRYNADTPDISESTGTTQLLTRTIELLRTLICDGSGNRHLFINPEYCPACDRATKEYHYPTHATTNAILSDNPDKAYSDEIDPLRYWAMYRITKYRERVGVQFL